jgi:hypothetical protein
MDNSFLTGCASAFWHITTGVCRAVGTCLGGLGRPATLPDDLVLEVHRRVMRAQRQEVKKKTVAPLKEVAHPVVKSLPK